MCVCVCHQTSKPYNTTDMHTRLNTVMPYNHAHTTICCLHTAGCWPAGADGQQQPAAHYVWRQQQQSNEHTAVLSTRVGCHEVGCSCGPTYQAAGLPYCSATATDHHHLSQSQNLAQYFIQLLTVPTAPGTPLLLYEAPRHLTQQPQPTSVRQMQPVCRVAMSYIAPPHHLTTCCPCCGRSRNHTAGSITADTCDSAHRQPPAQQVPFTSAAHSFLCMWATLPLC